MLVAVGGCCPAAAAEVGSGVCELDAVPAVDAGVGVADADADEGVGRLLSVVMSYFVA